MTDGNVDPIFCRKCDTLRMILQHMLICPKCGGQICQTSRELEHYRKIYPKQVSNSPLDRLVMTNEKKAKSPPAPRVVSSIPSKRPKHKSITGQQKLFEMSELND